MSEVLQLYRDKESILERKIRECDSDRSSWKVEEKKYEDEISASHQRERIIWSVRNDLSDKLKFANQQIEELKEEKIALRNNSNLLSDQLSKY